MLIYEPGGKYTKEEKLEYLRQAIIDGGFYGTNHIWNSIIVFSGDKHIYRGRVETLIIKDDKEIFLRFNKGEKDHHGKPKYSVPGGSFERDIPHTIQAENECNEEARIALSNIQSTGITYKDTVTPQHKWVKDQVVNWNGKFTEVYIGTYKGRFTGHVDKEDEDTFMVHGKFYDLDKIYPKLKKEHQLALALHYPTRFNLSKNLRENEKFVKESPLSSKERNRIPDNEFGIPSLRKFPLHDKEHVLAAIRMFNRVDKKHEKELAHNILNKMILYNIDAKIIGRTNRLRSYL